MADFCRHVTFMTVKWATVKRTHGLAVWLPGSENPSERQPGRAYKGNEFIYIYIP